MSERYKTTLQLAKEAKDWPLVAMLKGAEIKDWYSELHSIFSGACASRDDKAASRYFGLWMRAIEDGYLSPFIKKVKEVEVLFEHDNGGREAILEAQKAATLGRVNWAQEAWRELPSDMSMLHETREAILTEIANRWRNTPDEEEADNLFHFLATTIAEPRPRAEYGMLAGVLRKVTDSTFPLARLTRNLLVYYEAPYYTIEIACVLAIGRTRNALDPYSEVALVRHLEGASDPAFCLAEKFVKQVGALDRAVSTLRQGVQSERERRGDREGDGILYGKVEFEYQSLDVVNLSIQQRQHKENIQDWGHSQFELVRTRVQWWKRDNPNVSVHLKLIIKGEFSEDTIFVRKQEL